VVNIVSPLPATDAGSSGVSPGAKCSISDASSGDKNPTGGSESPEYRYYAPGFPEELGKLPALHQPLTRPPARELPVLAKHPHTQSNDPARVGYKGGRLDAFREVIQYWDSLKNLSTEQVLHEYKALVWWWEKNQSGALGNPDVRDDQHYQRLADLICVKSMLLMKGVKVDLQNLEDFTDVTVVSVSEAGNARVTANPGLSRDATGSS